MRLWHKGLLSSLPSKQLVAQWREICGITRDIDMIGTPNHILVNRIMDYPLSHLYSFATLVIDEMYKRGFAVSTVSFANFEKHIFSAMEKCNDTLDDIDYDVLFYNWHNDRYFWQCVTNLEEKYDCGGITDEEWDKIEEVSRLYTYPWE